jgi:hypothetical protein
MTSSETYSFPESLVVYISDPKIQTAVDALLASKPNKIDAEVWEDVTSYYNAYVGAQIVRGDWAIALHEIWSRVWADLPGASWAALGVADQAAEWNWSVDLVTLWDYSIFARAFRPLRRKGLVAFLAVSLSFETGVQVGVQLFDLKGKRLLSALGGYELDEDNDLLFSEERRLSLASELDLSEMQVEARRVWSELVRPLEP